MTNLQIYLDELDGKTDCVNNVKEKCFMAGMAELLLDKMDRQIEYDYSHDGSFDNFFSEMMEKGFVTNEKFSDLWRKHGCSESEVIPWSEDDYYNDDE